MNRRKRRWWRRQKNECNTHKFPNYEIKQWTIEMNPPRTRMRTSAKEIKQSHCTKKRYSKARNPLPDIWHDIMKNDLHKIHIFGTMEKSSPQNREHKSSSSHSIALEKGKILWNCARFSFSIVLLLLFFTSFVALQFVSCSFVRYECVSMAVSDCLSACVQVCMCFGRSFCFGSLFCHVKMQT